MANSPTGSLSRWSRWRTRLVWLSLSISVAWSAAVVVPGWLPGNAIGDRMLSPGDLSAAHAAWNSDCRVCHLRGAPQAEEARWLSSGIRSADFACAMCHANVDHTPVHHQHAAACRSCHHEHRGANASLVRVSETNCIGCHADAMAHHDLPRDRPPAASSIRFNHALHLRPGLGLTDDPPARPFRWQDIARVEARSRLKPHAAADDAPVELPCSACHQPRRTGSSFEPIRFETHCRACHPLTFDADAPASEVPHGLQPADVLTFVRGRRRVDRPDRAAADLREAADLLFRADRSCAACHALPTSPPNPDAIAAWSAVVISAPRTDRWPKHVAFGHASHASFACRDCHAAAFPGHPTASPIVAESLLPSLSTCASCHSPSGGARHGCADCHLFHR